MLKNKILRKVLAVSLAAVMLGSTGFTTVGQFIGTGGISVSAAEIQVYGDFQYEINDDNTVNVTKYTGSEENVEIPGVIEGKSVTSIGDKAFLSAKMTSITIPDSVETIGKMTFQSCKKILKITIPEKVTSISDSMFAYCERLEEVTIKGAVTEIGSSAFRSCKALRKITIPETVAELGFSAFYGSGLTEVTVPAGVTKMGGSAFASCKSMTNADLSKSNISDLPDSIFESCSNLRTVSLPNVRIIGGSAFKECSNLENISIPETVNEIKSYAFQSCTKLKNVTLPTTVRKIGNGVFQKCTAFTRIDIPSGTATIGDSAFAKCSNVTEVKLSETVVSIGESAFQDCEKLVKITIPEKVSEINKFVFSGCKALNHVTLPEILTKIYQYAFEDCISLRGIVIPENVNEIHCRAFEGCKSLLEIKISTNSQNYSSDDGILFNKDKTELIIYPNGKKDSYTIPDSVARIGNYAFSGANLLTDVMIPESVTQIGEDAFEGCTALKKITIPNSVKNIGNHAFQNSGLNEVIMPSNVKKLAKDEPIDKSYVFNGCENLFVVSNTVALGDNIYIEYLNASKQEVGKSTYSAYCKKISDTSWTKIKQDSTLQRNNAFSFKPQKATEYNVCFKIQDKNGSIKKYYQTVKVNPKLTMTAEISAEEITLGNSVDVQANGAGGIGKYQYAVYYKKASDAKWTTRQEFSDNNKITVKPAKATDYNICVKVMDNNGKTVKKYFDVKVNEKLSNTSVISATTIKKGESVTVNGSAKGGAGDYTYAVLYKQKAQTKWTTKQDFSVNNTISVKPAKATDYDICVKVKDTNGTIVKKYFTVNVTK